MLVQITGPLPSDELVRLRLEQQIEERRRDALQWLERTGAVIERGHFRFGKSKDERHGQKRVIPRRLFNRAFVRKWFIPALAESVPRELWGTIDIVAGPPTFGTLIASDLADYLSSQRKPAEPDVEALYFGRDWDGVFVLDATDRDRLSTGARVLLVDDVRHRGLTFLACHRAIVEAGGQVLATAELIDRGVASLPLMVPNYFVGQIAHDELFLPSDCPMCHSANPADREFTLKQDRRKLRAV